MDRAGFFRMDVVEPDVAEGVEAMLDPRGAGWGVGATSTSTRPIGTPDGGAYVTVADLIAFPRALAGGKLLGPELAAAALTPRVSRGRRGGLERMMGYGWEFLVSEHGRVRC
jgi:hypothetical protein